MSYTMYTPLNVWLDPASVTDVVAYIQTYLSENTIYSETEIETLIHDYLIAHPELIGGVQSVNGKTGTVVLSASDINTENITFTDSNFKFLQPELSEITRNLVYYKPSSFIRAIGHRGIYDAPENTLIGYKIAKLKGFNFVECDVQFTSDNIPVLLHDVSINRTARNADGSTISTTINVNSVTYSQLQNYDFGIYKGSQFAGTKIPTLNEFIGLCRAIGLFAYIEIKNNVTYTQAQLEMIVDIVKSFNMQERVNYSSFSDSYLSTIHQYDPNAEISYIVQTDITDEIVTTAQSLKSANDVYISALYENITSTGINKLIGAGIPLVYWTMNDAHLMIAANGYVAGFISDTTNAESILFYNAITL